MTSLPARPQYKGRREDTPSSSSSWLTVFVWSVHSGKSTVFSLSWRALARRLRLCVDPRPRYSTPDDTHNLCFFCLGKEHTRDVLEGKICVHCELFLWKKPRSRLSLFSRKEGQPSASCDSGPNAAVAQRRMKSWGSRVSCWIVILRSFWHHQIQRLVLCWVMPRKSRRCLRVRKLRLNPLNSPALHMNMLLEIMDQKKYRP